MTCTDTLVLLQAPSWPSVAWAQQSRSKVPDARRGPGALQNDIRSSGGCSGGCREVRGMAATGLVLNFWIEAAMSLCVSTSYSATRRNDRMPRQPRGSGELSLGTLQLPEAVALWTLHGGQTSERTSLPGLPYPFPPAWSDCVKFSDTSASSSLYLGARCQNS